MSRMRSAFGGLGVRYDSWRVTLNVAEETHYRATHTAAQKVAARSLNVAGRTARVLSSWRAESQPVVPVQPPHTTTSCGRAAQLDSENVHAVPRPDLTPNLTDLCVLELTRRSVDGVLQRGDQFRLRDLIGARAKSAHHCPVRSPDWCVHTTLR